MPLSLNENHIYIDELLKIQIKISYIYFYIKEISISKKIIDPFIK